MRRVIQEVNQKVFGMEEKYGATKY